jgi:hypothetical protein
MIKQDIWHEVVSQTPGIGFEEYDKHIYWLPSMRTSDDCLTGEKKHLDVRVACDGPEPPAVDGAQRASFDSSWRTL